MFIPTYKKGLLPISSGAVMPYITLGNGPVPLLLIPGAGDGLRTVYDASFQLAWYFRQRIRRYHMLLVSRRQPIPASWSLEQDANDYIRVIEKLNWGPTLLECNSGGGPIGQILAATRPDLVSGLLLSCTGHRMDEQGRAVLEHWLTLARQHRWTELSWSSIEYTFRPQTAARYRLLRPLLRFTSTPRDQQRLVRIFEQLLFFDNSQLLPQINCPTLVIGGMEDRIFAPELQREMAALIPHAELKLSPGYGHGNDQENPDYHIQVDRFSQEIYKALLQKKV